jgi:hypothetical protein
MPIKYLCIDDENSKAPEGYLNLVASKFDKSIFLERVHPKKEIALEIDEIKNHAAINKDTFGLILDLRLDRDPDEAGNHASYRGATMAQELRTRMAEGEISPFPIVLWSMDDMFKRSYEQDDTSHDLFDSVYIKDKDITENPIKFGLELISLVEGYKLITAIRAAAPPDLPILLGTDVELFNTFDPRILESIQLKCSKSTQECARFILSEIIKPEGLLIDENVLAARLGVNIEKSGDSWSRLKSILEVTKYTGVFSTGWYRWWSSQLDLWWLELAEKQTPLKRLGASDRVRVLNGLFTLTLIVAEPIAPNYSDRFWTICQILNLPLDSIDGFRASCPSLKPWQNPPYLSTQAVLERKGRDKWRVSPLEVSRLQTLKVSEST